MQRLPGPLRVAALGVALTASCGRIGYDVIDVSTEQADGRDSGVAAGGRDAGSAGSGGTTPASGGTAPASGGTTPASGGTGPTADAAPPPPVRDAAPDVSTGGGGDGAVTTPDASSPSDATSAPADAAPPDASTPPADAAPPPGTFCESVASLGVAPTLDGALEPGLTTRRITPVAWTGALPIPAGHHADYAVGWRPDGLYVYVDVTDDTPAAASPAEWTFCGDAVEIYVDDDGAFTAAPSYDVPGTMQLVVGGPASSADPLSRGELWNNVSQYQGAIATTQLIAMPYPGGYRVETFVTAAELGGVSGWTLAAGQNVGLALAIDLAEVGVDAGAYCPRRLGQYFSKVASTPDAGCGAEPFCNTDAFCVATLLP